LTKNLISLARFKYVYLSRIWQWHTLLDHPWCYESDVTKSVWRARTRQMYRVSAGRSVGRSIGQSNWNREPNKWMQLALHVLFVDWMWWCSTPEWTNQRSGTDDLRDISRIHLCYFC